MRLLSAELGEEVTFVTTTERELLDRLTSRGVPPAVTDLTGHAPRSVEAFLHENRELFR
jgi:hypothetical protein